MPLSHDTAPRHAAALMSSCGACALQLAADFHHVPAYTRPARRPADKNSQRGLRIINASSETYTKRPSTEGTGNMKWPRAARLQRPLRRRRVGSLGTLLSSKLTQTLYDKSLVSFVRWLRTENFAGPDSIDFLSQRFGEFVMSCWEDRHESPPKQLDLTHPAGRAKPARNSWKSKVPAGCPACWRLPSDRRRDLSHGRPGSILKLARCCSRFAHGLQRSTPAPGTPRYQHADFTHNAAMGKMLLSILDFKTGAMLVTRSIRGNTVTFL